ncbi:MAG: hypothetical protein QW802_00475, partial [Candidatus Altiarchaeota archaeon]
VLITISTVTHGKTFGDVAIEKLALEFNWRGIFIGVFYNVLLPSILIFYDNLQLMILQNPQLDNPLINGALVFFINLLEPFYVITIILCGFYLILMSSSPRGRANAKSLLLRLLISMFLVTLSIPILKFIFSASENLTSDILNFNPQGANIFRDAIIRFSNEFATKTAISFSGGHIFLMIEILLFFGIFSILSLRYLLLTIFSILMPLGIFFYFFNTTKTVGRKIFEQVFIWSFSQVILALVFTIGNISASILSHDLLLFIGFTASLLFISSPIALFIIMKRFLP